VWFVDNKQKLIAATIAREAVRVGTEKFPYDYTILLFDRDLPDSIQSLRVVSRTNLAAHFPSCPDAPWPFYKAEAGGHVSADIPGFTFPTWKGGDSGSPDMLNFRQELLFTGGRSTSDASEQMQADMDELCRLQNLNPKKYQLQWLDLSAFPTYSLTP
jgi:hypothetical protein